MKNYFIASIHTLASKYIQSTFEKFFFFDNTFEKFLEITYTHYEKCSDYTFQQIASHFNLWIVFFLKKYKEYALTYYYFFDKRNLL